MRAQTQAAIAEADAILFLIDVRAGVVPADEIFAELVRSSAKPVILVANKCEGAAASAGVYDAYRLGLGDPVAISAAHGDRVSALMDEVLAPFIESADKAADPGEHEYLRAAIPAWAPHFERYLAGQSFLLEL